METDFPRPAIFGWKLKLEDGNEPSHNEEITRGTTGSAALRKRQGFGHRGFAQPVHDRNNERHSRPMGALWTSPRQHPWAGGPGGLWLVLQCAQLRRYRLPGGR